MKQKKYRLAEIAVSLGRSVSTIWDELHRNRTRGRYDPAKAHHKAYVRRKYAKYQGMKIVRHDALRKEVTERLMDDQSPEAIAGHVSKYHRQLPAISKNALYRFIAIPYGRRIETHRWFKRRRRRGHYGKRRTLTDRTFIGKRPQYINKRKRIGDAESDFIVSGKSGKGILLVIADRKSRSACLERIVRVSIPRVEESFVAIKQRFPELQTITTDNDLLLQHHKRLEALLRIRIFFCEPHHPWEKGTVENTNKVIRRDIPKGSNISRYSRQFVVRLEAKLNRRPMQCLNDKTPQMVLAEYRRRRDGSTKLTTRNKKRPR